MNSFETQLHAVSRFSATRQKCRPGYAREPTRNSLLHRLCMSSKITAPDTLGRPPKDDVIATPPRSQLSPYDRWVGPHARSFWLQSGQVEEQSWLEKGGPR
jgi:hypothetical protein